MAVNTNWDADRYHRVAQPHAAWGASVIDRLELSGDEVVLDAGCGSGRVTAQLLERLPRGRLIGVDNSASMLAQARQTLAPYADRVELVEADLLELGANADFRDRDVDLVFSTAVFHWIADHPRLFAALRGVVRPGGRLVAQCGGGDNLGRFMATTDVVAARQPFAEHLAGKALWRFYAWPEETEGRLVAAGFATAEAWLEPSPQRFASAEGLKDFARGVVLSAHLTVLPDALRDAFAEQVVQEIHVREGDYVLDYVRLNMQASA
jgi:trans-aconitate 2-methyltransferase